MGLEASYTASIISQDAKIEAQGRLANVNSAQFTGVHPSGRIVNGIPGLVLDFDGPSGRQRIALQITDSEVWFDLVLHMLGLVFDEEQIDEVVEILKKKAVQAKDEGRTPVVRREVPESEVKYEEDPNG